MKRRLLCLLMCLLMIGSVLIMSGCSSEDSDSDTTIDLNDETDRSTMTLSMYIMTEQPVDEATKTRVTDAVNKITKAKFKTQLVLNFYTEEEYYEKLEADFAAKENDITTAANEAAKLKLDQKIAKARGETYVEITTEVPDSTVEETIKNEYGITELKYPELVQNQIDIFYFGGLDRYEEYVDNEWLASLDEELSGSSKKLNSYISSVYLDAAKINGTTYAIPNNTVIGEYTYLLLNKELLAKYQYDPTKITSVTDIKPFLSDIATYETDYAPMKGDLDIYRTYYWSVDTDTLEINRTDFSIFGSTYTNYATLGTLLPIRTVFSSAQYKEQLLTNKYIEENGYLVSDTDSRPYAATIVKGGAELEKVYGEDYEMIVLEAPRAYEADLYNNMIGVGAYTKSVSRSMEIITYLNTNADFRNLIQYGIENENYELDADGALTRLNQKYMLDINKTGNVFIAYPEEGSPLDVWEYGKQQNLVAQLDPILGFKIEAEDNLNVTLMDEYNTLSEEYKQKLDACQTYAELESFLSTVNDELLAIKIPPVENELYTSEEKAIVTINDVEYYNLYYLYFEKWYKSSGYYVEE